MAIICSCLPTLRPLASRFWIRLPLTFTSKSRLPESRTHKENAYANHTQSVDEESKGSTTESFRGSENSVPTLLTNEAEKNGIRKTFEVEVNRSDG